MQLETVLPASSERSDQQLAVFALINLGLLESLTNGLISPSEAVRVMFNAVNGRFVRKQLGDKTADEIMSRGVQLPDLFDALPAEEAHREFQRELAAMRSLCHKLLDGRRLVA
jgi:hypothetical protein